MGELRQAGDDVADGVDAGLGGLLCFVDLDEAAVEFDLVFSMPTSSVRGARPTATRTFSASFSTGLPLAPVQVTLTPVAVFSIFSTLASGVDVDAALFEEAGELLGDLFVFRGHDARQEFEDGDLGAEAAEDGAELDADGAGADDDEGFRHLGDGEDFDVGEDAVVWLEAEDHLGVGAGGEDDVLRFDFALRAVSCSEIDGVDAVFGGAGERPKPGITVTLFFFIRKPRPLVCLSTMEVLRFEHVIPVEGAGRRRCRCRTRRRA